MAVVFPTVERSLSRESETKKRDRASAICSGAGSARRHRSGREDMQDVAVRESDAIQCGSGPFTAFARSLGLSRSDRQLGHQQCVKAKKSIALLIGSSRNLALKWPDINRTVSFICLL